MDLAVVIPTRGRPAAAAKLIDVCRATCTADTYFVLAVDDNDPCLPEYRALAARDVAVVVDTGPHGHVHAINIAAMAAIRWTDRPFAIAKLDDDHRPTLGWDTAYVKALRDMGGTGVVYGNDLLRGQQLPTAPAVTADIVEALGYMAPPELGHLYCDDFWRDLGMAAGCLRYLPDVVVEHLHPAAGKAEWDDGYLRVNSPKRIRDDAAAYTAYVAERQHADAVKVAALVKRPPALPTVVDRAACVAAFGDWQHPMLKHADDLVRYARVIGATRPDVVVECGTRTGHSALWFADEGCYVVTVDVEDQVPAEVKAAAGSRVTWLVGGSLDPWVVDAVRELTAGRRTMVSLDSDHSADHVTQEIGLYAPIVTPGCHLVVEDGVIAWLDGPTLMGHACHIYIGNPLDAVHRAHAAGTLDGFIRDVDVETMAPATMFPAGWWCRT